MSGFSIKCGDEFLNSNNTHLSECYKIQIKNMNCEIFINKDTQYCTDTNEDVTAILHGHLTSFSPVSTILDNYTRNGIHFLDSIDGSFILLILDKRNQRIFVVTDILSSLTAYIYSTESSVIISTSLLDLLKLSNFDSSLDYTGVAWYLSNGVIHNDRTLFKNIRKCPSASCITITPKGFSSHKYWSCEFSDEYDFSNSKVSNRLKELIVASIEKRVKRNEPNYVSLSAGYDSVGILAILRSYLCINDIRSFSYGLVDNIEGSDPYIANNIAAKLNSKHGFYTSYKGDICNAIEYNALRGSGSAVFCAEPLVWTQLEQEQQNSRNVCFFGDEWFGRGFDDKELHTIDDVVNASLIKDFKGLRWLESYMPNNIFREMDQSIQDEITDIVGKCPPTNDLHNIKDFIYLDQRLSNIVLPWRENFTGHIFCVQNPFLDREIIEFVQNIPGKVRTGKTFYISMITSMFPSLFSTDRAQSSACIPNWLTDIRMNRKQLIQEFMYDIKSSPLDDIIPPNIVVNIINARIRPSVFALPGSIPRRIARKLLKYSRLSNYENTIFPNTELESALFLLRYLVLRRFLDSTINDC